MVVWGDGMNYLIWFGGGPGSLFAEHQGTPLKGPQKGGSGITGCFNATAAVILVTELRGRLIGVYVKPCARSSSAPRNNPLEKNLRCLFAPSKAAVAIGTSVSETP
jgi:hypothetical protein